VLDAISPISVDYCDDMMNMHLQQLSFTRQWRGDEADEDGVIYFGADEHQKEEQLDSKRPEKRQKQKEAQSHAKSSSNAQFLLPHSDTQNGPPLLCLGGTRGVIKVIDTYRRSLFMTLSGHGNDITDLKFSPSNEWLLLSASKDESIRLWNLRRGVNVAVFTGHNGHRGQVLSVGWHLSGNSFASCGMDNMVKLWKVFDSDEESKGCGPVEMAIKKSFGFTPGADTGNGRKEVRQTNKFGTIFQQFPYFSTNKAHTNYVGKFVFFSGTLVMP